MFGITSTHMDYKVDQFWGNLGFLVADVGVLVGEVGFGIGAVDWVGRL